jgi:riboflavin kinase/FMN adenylyltransferase
VESREPSPPAPGRVVAVGNFDGVHLGHQAVLADAARDAAARGLEPAVLTFSPHPLAVLGRRAGEGPSSTPRLPPPTLTVLGRKRELIGRVAPSIRTVVERFDLAFAAQSPRAFAERVLVAQLSARVVIVGKNFRFGHDRAGDFDTLSRLGEELGFETRSHALIGDDRGPWSSTRVRDALARGDVEDAARMLGRPHLLSGVVVEGDRRGRTIGFPTCNLAGVEEALPAFGVYAVRVDREVGPAPAPDEPWGPAAPLAGGVANIGVRPTVKEGGAAPSVEVHLFDLDEDLYGARLRVSLVARLRAEQRFNGLDALKAQIAKDAADARERLSREG